MTLNKQVKIFKGHVIFTPEPKKYEIIENGYIVVNGSKVVNVFKSLPEEYKGVPVVDYGNKLIVPGLVDLHFHAPQFENRGLGMDKELLPWLETYTFPEESKFKDLNYASKVYKRVIKEVWRQGTTRIVLFATLHEEATELLMDLFIKAGLGAYIGNVNMDRNSPDFLVDDTATSLKKTENILKKYSGKSDLVKPIVTPRFVPTCTPELMKGLGELAKKYNAPVQSHLSENQGELAWVHELHPDLPNYGSVYDEYGLFGQTPTLMAHCIYSTPEEFELAKKRGVWAVHCPDSNLNLGSGMMPIRKYLNEGMDVGFGSDVGAGHKVSIFECMVRAMEVSKMRWLSSNKEWDFLSTEEAFYLATKGGGKFFGKVGSFEEGYDFDALVIDDGQLGDTDNLSIPERLQRYIYIGDDRNIVDRYCAGNKIEEPVLD